MNNHCRLQAPPSRGLGGYMSLLEAERSGYPESRKRFGIGLFVIPRKVTKDLQRARSF